MVNQRNLLEENYLDFIFNQMLFATQLYDRNPKHISLLVKAYDLAKNLHKGVKRKSGEAYMFHPLIVALMTVKYHLDYVTTCTALLHDVVEDTEYTYQDILNIFGKEIADNVDCVSKMTKEDFNNKRIDVHVGTICKLFRHLNETDIRGPIVKLFDRDHNMKTLEAMKPEKQLIKSQETLDVYAPLAQGFGFNYLKKELHDLAFKYLYPLKYNEVEQVLDQLTFTHQTEINIIKQDIYNALKNNHLILANSKIDDVIKLRVKNLYSVFISLEKGRDYDDIHDLFALQITVANEAACFSALNLIHQKYPYFDDKFKDYIHNPKTTGYKAVHTTFVSRTGQSYQAQIRTKEMALRNTRGILYDLACKSQNLEEIKKHYPFFTTLDEIDRQYPNDFEFYDKIKNDLLGDKIYVRSASGKVYSLPVGATIVDYAYCICESRAPHIVEGKVNGQLVSISTVLKNHDLVDFTSNNTRYYTDETLLAAAKTNKAKRRILEGMNKNG